MSIPKFKDKHLYDSMVNPANAMSIINKKFKNLPKKYLFVYEKFALRYFLRKYKPKKLVLSGRMTIYLHKDIGFVRMEGIGAPYTVGFMENLIGLGGKVFLNIGFAGGLHKEGIILCKKSLRDEGTSHHYIPHGDYAHPDEELTKKLANFLDKNKVEYSAGDSWTTDSYFRETKEEVAKYSKEGIIAVEMESSALFTVGKFRNVKVASAFVVSDILRDKWEQKAEHYNVKGGLKKLVDLGIKFLGNNGVK
ncbi:MAG: nucleoside phosphorylase [Nanoarchaeota archaeon]